MNSEAEASELMESLEDMFPLTICFTVSFEKLVYSKKKALYKYLLLLL